MAGEGRKRLERAFKDSLEGKQDKPRLFKALMGAYVDGVKTVKVANRPDFVWVRLRGATGEVVQAFNDNVGEHFDLPIFVARDPQNPHIWKVMGRDIGQYGDWGGASYLPPHGRTHTFVGGDDTGSDVVFVAKRQYMELLPRPNNTGSVTIYIEPGYYFWDGFYHYWPGSGTANLLSYRPTGANLQAFVTVYIDGDTLNPAYLKGTEFNVQYPIGDPTSYIAVPNVDQGIPIAAVRLLTGTTEIVWNDIYDLRLPPSMLPGTGSQLTIFDEGSLLGNVSGLNFVGENVEVVISGSYGHVFVTGSTGGGPGTATGTATYLLVGQPEPLESITGTYWRTPGGLEYATGSINAFINGVSQIKDTAFEEQFPESGTYRYLFTPTTGSAHEVKFGVPVEVTGADGPAGPPGAPGAMGVYGLDDGVPLGTGTWLEAGDDLDASLSGTVLRLDVTHPSFPAELIGIFGLDEGIPLGTGTWVDFVGAGVAATLSGTTLTVTIPGGGGAGSFGVYGIDDGVPIGTGTWFDAGDRLSFSISGTTLRMDADAPVFPVEQIGVYGLDEGVLLGTGTWMNFRGPNVTATISGTVLDIFVTGSIGGAGGVDQIGVYIQEDGTPLGTGTTLNFQDRVTAVLSGTQAFIDVAAPVFPEEEIGVYIQEDGTPLGTGTTLNFQDRITAVLSGTQAFIDVTAPAFPEEEIGVYVTDEGIPLGTGTTLDFLGGGVTATISGTVVGITIPAAAVPPVTGSVVIYDETNILDSFPELRFIGGGVQVFDSGSYAAISIPAVVFPVDQIGVYGLDDGVPVGTGTWLEAGDRMSASISGTTLRLDVDAPVFPEEEIGLYFLSEGSPLQTGTWMDVQGRLNVVLTGTVAYLSVENPTFPEEEIGVYILEDGTPLGTGTSLNFQERITAVLSGTQAFIDVTAPTFPQEVIGVYVTDEGVPIGTGTTLDFIGGGVDATISGTTVAITIPQNTLPPVTGTVVMLNEGWVSGSFPQIDLAGEWVTLGVSGSRATILVPQRVLDEIGDVNIQSIQDWDFLRFDIGQSEWINTPLPPAAYTGSVVVYDEGTFLDAFKELRFIGGGVVALDSGSYAAISIPSPTFPQEVIGVYGLNSGVPLGTGSWLDFRNNLNATISGTVITIDGQAGGGGGVDQIGVMVWDEGVPLQTGTTLNFVGAPVTATISGTVALIEIAGNEGGYATYQLVGVPEPLDTITGAYWRTPGGTAYATGSLNAFIDGISQLKGTAFTEQYPVSGTYQYLENPPTGTVHEVKFGVAVSIIGPQGTPGQAGVGVYGLDDGVPQGTGTWIDWGSGLSATISGTVLAPILDESYPAVWTDTHYFDKDVRISGSLYLTQWRLWDAIDGILNITHQGEPKGYWDTAGLKISGTVYSEFLEVGDQEGDPFDFLPLSGFGKFASFNKKPYFITDAGTAYDLSVTGSAGGGGGVDQIGIYGLDDGVPLGTGTWIDFGWFLDASISGTTLRVDATHPPFPEEEIGVYILEDGTPLGTGTSMNFQDRITAVLSGTQAFIDVAAPVFPEEEIGVYIQEDGTPLGTGTTLNFQDRITAVLSGTQAFIDVAAPTFPQEVIGVYGLDDGVPLGTGSWIDFRNNLTATISGTVITVDAAAGGGAGGIGVYGLDEGFPLGTGSWMNFTGEGVTATISGTVIDVNIPNPIAGSGSTYVRAGNPSPLDTQTGGYWKIPDPEYATGSLSVAINGVWQQPVTDFSEQYPASGTFEVLAGMETGSILSSIWGVLGGSGGGGASGDVIEAVEYTSRQTGTFTQSGAGPETITYSTGTVTLDRECIVHFTYTYQAVPQNGNWEHGGWNFLINGATSSPIWYKRKNIGPQSSEQYFFTITHAELLAAGTHGVEVEVRDGGSSQRWAMSGGVLYIVAPRGGTA